MGYGLKKLSLALSAVVIAYFLMFSGNKFDPADVQDKKVLITGASSGIGEQMAYHFAKMGANLVLTARRENLLKEVVKKCKKLSPKPTANHAYMVADMKELDNTKKLIKFSVDTLKGLDILVLNHARVSPFDMWFGSQRNLTDLATEMDINFRAYVHLASHALPHLLKSKGRIAFVSSVTERIPIPGMTMYIAAKHAIQGFFGVLRQEMVMRNTGVSVTSCIVAGTRTEIVMENFRQTLGEETLNSLNFVDPTVVAFEVVKATVARQYEVHTTSDRWSSTLMFLKKISPELVDQLTLKVLFSS